VTPILGAMVRRLPLRLLLGLAAALGVVGRAAAADCVVPTYRTFLNTIGPEGGSANLSVSPDDFSVATLLCLANALNRQHPDWKRVSVFIFSSDREASDYSGIQVAARSDVARAVRARLEFDGAARALTLMPIGVGSDYFVHAPGPPALQELWGPRLYDTTIRIPSTAAPACRLAIQRRCLLALEAFAYPEEAVRDQFAGTVTIRGTVGRDGRVTGEVVDGSKNPVIERAALHNVSTWWVDPAPREDHFQITFTYVIDPAQSPDVLDLEVGFPDTMTIRGNPRVVISGALCGKVRDLAGRDAANVELDLVDRHGARVAESHSDQNGRFRFPLVYNERYRIESPDHRVLSPTDVDITFRSEVCEQPVTVYVGGPGSGR
jgi:TonB family protein